LWLVQLVANVPGGISPTRGNKLIRVYSMPVSLFFISLNRVTLLLHLLFMTFMPSLLCTWAPQHQLRPQPYLSCLEQGFPIPFLASLHMCSTQYQEAHTTHCTGIVKRAFTAVVYSQLSVLMMGNADTDNGNPSVWETTEVRKLTEKCVC
jgi:hypothetical protein